MNRFAAALARPDVTETCTLRGRFGFMAFHGGALEAMTDVIAAHAAAASDASFYGVAHPPDLAHFPSIEVAPSHSAALSAFLDHVDVVVAVHGFGREGMFTTLLLGGSNRELATHLANHLAPGLPEYEFRTDLEAIPRELRGQHRRNPVNLPRDGGVQVELPPRIRGSSPIWKDWHGPGFVPHTMRLIEGLAEAARRWELREQAAR